MKRILHYRLAPLFALILTILLYQCLRPLGLIGDSGTRYIYKVFFERGPMQYAIVFIGFYVATMALIARFRRDYRNSMVLGLFIYALFPILAGLFATILGIGSALARNQTILAQATTPDEKATATWGLVGEIGTSFDTVLLGLLAALIVMPLIFRLCVIDKTQKQSSAEPGAGAYSG